MYTFHSMLLGAFPVSAKSGANSTNNNKNGKCRFLLLCGGYILFLVLGAAMFSAIEAPKIDAISKRVQSLRNQFLQNNACLNGKWDCWFLLKHPVEKCLHLLTFIRSNSTSWTHSALFGNILYRFVYLYQQIENLAPSKDGLSSQKRNKPNIWIFYENLDLSDTMYVQISYITHTHRQTFT